MRVFLKRDEAQLWPTIGEEVGPLVPPLVSAAIADDDTITQAVTVAVEAAVDDLSLVQGATGLADGGNQLPGRLLIRLA